MQSKIVIALSSPVFWSLAGLAAYNGLSSILPNLTGSLQMAVNLALVCLAVYVHPGEIQKASATPRVPIDLG